MTTQTVREHQVDIDRAMRQARVTVTVAAPPTAIFDVLADPSLHPVIDGSGGVATVVNDSTGNPRRLEQGARFGMSMRLSKLAYPITNRVVEFDENRRIAWRHFAGHRWRWELDEVDGDSARPATRVVHTFDWSTSHWPWALELVNVPERNVVGMTDTVSRLDAVVTGGVGANSAGDRR